METDIPFFDPLDGIISIDPSSIFDENPDLLGPSEFPINYWDDQQGFELQGILDSDDPLSDPFIWAFCNDQTDNYELRGDHLGAGPSRVYGESGSIHCGANEDVPMPISVVGVVTEESQYNCTFCQTLRAISHTNGMNVKRLEIHGRLGIITHAVLGVYDFDSSFHSHSLQMFDFLNESIQTVKKFMIQYFETCKHEGYTTMEDPLSTFYDALCVGLNERDDTNDFLPFSPDNTDGFADILEEMLNFPPEDEAKGGEEFMKIPLAMQRERTRKLKLKDFKGYFHLPIEAAARKMKICPTVMKKVCRKNGVLRWPYRKINSIQGKISKKRKILESGDHNEEEIARALEDIQRHERDLANIYEAYSR